MRSALFASLSARQRRPGIGAALGQQSGDYRAVSDRQTLAEFSHEDLAGELRALIALERQRHASGEQARLRKGLRPLEGHAHCAANALKVAPHIAALGGIDIEWRVAPALRREYRSEQNGRQVTLTPRSSASEPILSAAG